MDDFYKKYSVVLSKNFILTNVPEEETVFEVVADEFLDNELSTYMKNVKKLPEKKLAFIEGAGEWVISVIILPVICGIIKDYTTQLIKMGIKNIREYYNNKKNIEKDKDQLKIIMIDNCKKLKVDYEGIKAYEEKIIDTILEHDEVLQSIFDKSKSK
jgi:hypothetical protein